MYRDSTYHLRFAIVLEPSVLSDSGGACAFRGVQCRYLRLPSNLAAQAGGGGGAASPGGGGGAFQSGGGGGLSPGGGGGACC